MQFLPANRLGVLHSVGVSIPLLNKLYLGALGRKNAQMGRFGLMSQANWQGAPSRGSVEYL